MHSTAIKSIPGSLKRKTVKMVKFSLCLIMHYNKNIYRRLEMHLHAFITSALYGDEWPTTPYVLVGRTPVIHWIED
jgi:hypothetical protein